MTRLSCGARVYDSMPADERVSGVVFDHATGNLLIDGEVLAPCGSIVDVPPSVALRIPRVVDCLVELQAFVGNAVCLRLFLDRRSLDFATLFSEPPDCPLVAVELALWCNLAFVAYAFDRDGDAKRLMSSCADTDYVGACFSFTRVLPAADVVARFTNCMRVLASIKIECEPCDQNDFFRIVIHGADDATIFVRDWHRTYSGDGFLAVCGPLETLDAQIGLLQRIIGSMPFTLNVSRPERVFLPDGEADAVWAWARWPAVSTAIVDFMLAMPGLTPYVVLWIIDWLPGSMCHKEHRKIALIERVYHRTRSLLVPRAAAADVVACAESKQKSRR